MIGGDGLVMSIAAASIIAKVTRDRLMCALAQDCPGYGFEQHKGYSVPEHLEALAPARTHRASPPPVRARGGRAGTHQLVTLDNSIVIEETTTDVATSAAI